MRTAPARPGRLLPEAIWRPRFLSFLHERRTVLGLSVHDLAALMRRDPEDLKRGIRASEWGHRSDFAAIDQALGELERIALANPGAWVADHPAAIPELLVDHGPPEPL